MHTLSEIKPTAPNLIVDLVRQAGVDVSDWKNWKGGEALASRNPRYCYDWSFIQPGELVVLNLWHEELQEAHGVITRQLNPREWASRAVVPRKQRALKMDQHIHIAYSAGLPVRVVVLGGTIRKSNNPNAKASRANKRLLDPVAWAVSAYDTASGECLVTRGAEPAPPTGRYFDEEGEGYEGEAIRLLRLHRKREARLRKLKLAEAVRLNQGRIVCEVPNCSFDFAEKYGDLGIGYAQVHHKEPLSKAPTVGRCATLADLAVVCANCHVMIHRDGKSRPLASLILRRSR